MSLPTNAVSTNKQGVYRERTIWTVLKGYHGIWWKLSWYVCSMNTTYHVISNYIYSSMIIYGWITRTQPQHHHRLRVVWRNAPNMTLFQSMYCLNSAIPVWTSGICLWDILPCHGNLIGANKNQTNSTMRLWDPQVFPRFSGKTMSQICQRCQRCQGFCPRPHGVESWLVVWNMFIFPYIGLLFIPIDFHIYFPRNIGLLIIPIDFHIYFPRNIGLLSSSQLTNSYIFQDGVALAHQPVKDTERYWSCLNHLKPTGCVHWCAEEDPQVLVWQGVTLGRWAICLSTVLEAYHRYM